MNAVNPRWMNAEQAAAYIGCRVDHLPRLVRTGKLPEPSRALGPRNPRWDREALDALFGGAPASASMDPHKVEADVAAAIIARARARGASPSRRRIG
jgi:hypothetical protein